MTEGSTDSAPNEHSHGSRRDQPSGASAQELHAAVVAALQELLPDYPLSVGPAGWDTPRALITHWLALKTGEVGLPLGPPPPAGNGYWQRAAGTSSRWLGADTTFADSIAETVASVITDLEKPGSLDDIFRNRATQLVDAQTGPNTAADTATRTRAVDAAQTLIAGMVLVAMRASDRVLVAAGLPFAGPLDRESIESRCRVDVNASVANLALLHLTGVEHHFTDQDLGTNGSLTYGGPASLPSPAGPEVEPLRRFDDQTDAARVAARRALRNITLRHGLTHNDLTESMTLAVAKVLAQTLQAPPAERTPAETTAAERTAAALTAMEEQAKTLAGQPTDQPASPAALAARAALAEAVHRVTALPTLEFPVPGWEGAEWDIRCLQHATMTVAPHLRYIFTSDIRDDVLAATMQVLSPSPVHSPDKGPDKGLKQCRDF